MHRKMKNIYLRLFLRNKGETLPEEYTKFVKRCDYIMLIFSLNRFSVTVVRNKQIIKS